MDVVQFEEKIIKGISTRTNNADEMNTDTAKIATLYNNFDEKVPVDYKNGACVYGVYFNYESDALGEFSVLAGADKLSTENLADLEDIILQSGKYMVFKNTGEMPQAVIETWGEIWAYFSDQNLEYQRAYLTDFEFYKNQNEVEVYIGIK